MFHRFDGSAVRVHKVSHTSTMFPQWRGAVWRTALGTEPPLLSICIEMCWCSKWDCVPNAPFADYWRLFRWFVEVLGDWNLSLTHSVTPGRHIGAGSQSSLSALWCMRVQVRLACCFQPPRLALFSHARTFSGAVLSRRVSRQMCDARLLTMSSPSLWCEGHEEQLSGTMDFLFRWPRCALFLSECRRSRM